MRMLKGYNDILKIDDLVKVRRTNHVARISKVISTPSGTCYHIKPPDPNDLGGFWYLRVGLIEIGSIKL